MRKFTVVTAVLATGLLVTTGCKKVTYIEDLAGDWTGEAVSGATVLPTTATFLWDDEEEKFSGSIDFDGYVYYVGQASSDKETAQLELTPLIGQGPGSMTDVVLEGEEKEEKNKLSAKVKLNVCPNGEGAPAECELVGAATLTRAPE
jgi:hypothetical protein